MLDLPGFRRSSRYTEIQPSIKMQLYFAATSCNNFQIFFQKQIIREQQLVGGVSTIISIHRYTAIYKACNFISLLHHVITFRFSFRNKQIESSSLLEESTGHVYYTRSHNNQLTIVLRFNLGPRSCLVLAVKYLFNLFRSKSSRNHRNTIFFLFKSFFLVA